MEELYFSKEQREVPLSQYKIIKPYNKYGFKVPNAGIKKGTLIGFTDKNGNMVTFEEMRKKKLEKKQEKNNEEGLNL